MNNYETVFIVTPVLSDIQVKEVADKFQGIITENAGFYFLIEFTGEGSLVDILETGYRRDERIIRFLTFKQDKYAVEYSEKRRAKLANKSQEE